MPFGRPRTSGGRASRDADAIVQCVKDPLDPVAPLPPRLARLSMDASEQGADRASVDVTTSSAHRGAAAGVVCPEAVDAESAMSAIAASALSALRSLCDDFRRLHHWFLAVRRRCWPYTYTMSIGLLCLIFGPLLSFLQGRCMTLPSSG